MRTSIRYLVCVSLLALSSTQVWAQEELTITKIYSPAATDLTIAPTQDAILDPTGNDVLPGTGYDINLGQLTRKYLTLHAAELWVETLVAQNTLATIGGRIVVAPTTTLTADVTAADTGIQVKHNNLQNGDRVYLESDGKVEFIAIISGAFGSGPYSYNVTRNLDGSGTNDWFAGDAVLNTGQSGNGFIDLYSVRGVKAGTEIGPTIVFNQRLSSTYNDWAPRAAIGNLDGLYGYSGSTYGFASGVPSGARVTVDTTNGIRIYGGDNDQKVTIDTSGNATFDGKLTVGTGRNILRNSECRVGTENWSTLVSGHSATITLGTSLSSDWRLNNEPSTCYINAASQSPANASTTYVLLSGQKFPAAANIRYEASAYIGLHRATNAVVYINWYNSAGADNGQSAVSNTCTTSNQGGQLITGYCRAVTLAAAPSGTYSAELVIRTTHSGENDPFTFWTRAYFGEASTTQEDPTEWGPAGITEITNGLIKTDAIDARAISADSITTSELAANAVIAENITAGVITADKLNVSTLSAITANLGTVTAGSISGVTASFGGSGEVALNSSGIQIAAGTGDANRIDWSDGGYVVGNSDVLFVGADSLVELAIGSGFVYSVGLDSSGVFSEQGIGDVDLGSTSALFDDLFVRKIRATTLGGTGSTSFVCTDNDGDFYAQATTCDGSAPAPAAMAAQLQDYESELIELRRAVAELRAELATVLATQEARQATRHRPSPTTR
jgi:hypothetical protein